MSNTDPIAVLIIDDSRIFRSELESALNELPGVSVVGSVFSGEKAIEFLQKTQVDLITLDIAMPGMSGIETLKQIRSRKFLGRSGRRVEALLLSSLTTHGAQCTMEGLELGAYDFLLKPDGPSQSDNRAQLRTQLAEKLKPLRYQQSYSAIAKLSSYQAPKPAESASQAICAIAIGVSTGGPEALASLLPVLTTQSSVPILIVQHNLQGFNEFLADSLSRRLPRPINVPLQQQEVSPDGIYLAKGGQHMLVSKVSDRIVVHLSDAPAENQFKPSVDMLFRSAAACYGQGLIAVVLTGMLNDGAQGVRVVKRSGGLVLAQDEATSVVWGMPRAAIDTGAVDKVLPLSEVGPQILNLIADPTRSRESFCRKR